MRKYVNFIIIALTVILIAMSCLGCSNTKLKELSETEKTQLVKNYPAMNNYPPEFETKEVDKDIDWIKAYSPIIIECKAIKSLPNIKHSLDGPGKGEHAIYLKSIDMGNDTTIEMLQTRFKVLDVIYGNIKDKEITLTRNAIYSGYEPYFKIGGKFILCIEKDSLGEYVPVDIQIGSFYITDDGKRVIPAKQKGYYKKYIGMDLKAFKNTFKNIKPASINKE